MNIALCTIHNEAYKDLSDITFLRNKIPYCDKNKYDLIFRDKNFEISNLGFEKINLVNQTLNSNKYEYVMWLGCDALITNFSIKIEDRISKNFDLTISSDSNWQINSDSFIIKNSDRSKDFLNSILNSYSEYINNPFYEQASMIDFINSDRFKNFCSIIPQRMINSYNYFLYGHIPKMHSKKDFYGNDGDWRPGDFILHWPGVTMENRLIMANNLINQVIEK